MVERGVNSIECDELAGLTTSLHIDARESSCSANITAQRQSLLIKRRMLHAFELAQSAFEAVEEGGLAAGVAEGAEFGGGLERFSAALTRLPA